MCFIYWFFLINNKKIFRIYFLIIKYIYNMADFGTILRNEPNSLNLFCNSVVENQNAYVVFGTVNTATTITPASPLTLNWNGSTDKLIYNIDEPDSGTFRLINNGVYLIDFSTSVDLPAIDGGQGIAQLIVDGTVKSGDVAFSSAASGPQASIKLTLKGSVVKTNPTPINVSIRLSTLTTNMVFRYGQISITRIG
jgi:hypothetical protein